MTDAGVRALGSLPFLRSLDLSYLSSFGHMRGVTGECFAADAGFPALSSLDLKLSNRVSDAGLARVAELSGLERLVLYECERVSDAGVRRLTNGLHRLRTLDLSRLDGRLTGELCAETF